MEKTPIEGTSREPLLPRNPREPGLREATVRAALGSGQTGGRELHCVFHLILEMPIEKSDVRKIIAELQATSWCLRECIRVRELAATHRLGQMRRLQMLEKKKAWKREAGFD